MQPQKDIQIAEWPGALPEIMMQETIGWCRLWGVESVLPRLRVQLSRRQKTSLGLAYCKRSLVRIHLGLTEPSPATEIACVIVQRRTDLLREVLCHEVAHIAAWELHGNSIRPHGREWRALMRAAGFPPRSKVPVADCGWCVGMPSPRRLRRRRWTTGIAPVLRQSTGITAVLRQLGALLVGIR